MPLDLDSVPFVAAAHHYNGRPGPPNLVVLHSTEGGEYGTAAEETANVFAHPSSPSMGSTQFVVDQDSIIRCVRDTDGAWGAGGVNDRALHVEQCGTAHQSRDEWLDGPSRATIANAARVVAAWSRRYGIPVGRRLSAVEVRARAAGLCMHYDVTVAFPEYSRGHWDCGPSYPWDVLLADVARELGVPAPPAEEDEEMSEWVLIAPDVPFPSGPFRGKRPTVLALSGAPTGEQLTAEELAAASKRGVRGPVVLPVAMFRDFRIVPVRE